MHHLGHFKSGRNRPSLCASSKTISDNRFSEYEPVLPQALIRIVL